MEKHKLETRLCSMPGIGAKAHPLHPKANVRSEGKAKRVADNRYLRK